MLYERARICVDLDDQAQPQHWSYVLWSGGERVCITVGPPAGPFDTPAEVMAEGLKEMIDTHGAGVRLFT